MIVEMNVENIEDINKSNESFQVIGKIIPKFENDTWTFSEVLFVEPYLKSYPNDEEDYSEYINNPEKAVFFYYMDDKCVGQIRVRSNWNKYCYIEDIAVCNDNRGNGIGRVLINKSIEWAKQNNLYGLMLETQDINLLACRFYHKYGFKIGAVDTMLYANFNNHLEKAIFWYLKFE